MDEPLREVISGTLGVGDAPPVLSVVLGETSGASRTKHQLHVHGKLTQTASDDGSLARGVVRVLGALGAARPSGTLRLQAFVVVDRSRSAIVVDRRLRDDFRRMEPRLRRMGRRVIDVPEVWVRPDDATCVLPDSAELLGVRLDAFEERWPDQGFADDLRGGEIAIDRLVYRGHAGPTSSAAAVAEMLPLLWDSSRRVDAENVETIAALSSRLRTEPTPSGDVERLRATLE